ncbi:radial spoke head protein 6 homolog A-like [Episyrphus balteatus]|uniref:radial spoke head protein 6 homolog A-like n=1 Tax=Episyrphus balteatus TaxID=286459 RepID=UPI0024856913|nr:radial spoke head protein 6 homolog A-like [Episyrphus balteatus]
MPLYKSLSPLISKDNGEKDSTNKCPSEIYPLSISNSEFTYQNSKTHLFKQNHHPPNIEHELNVVKSILQQGSSVTGDSLFDHLADVIKLVIKERPPNIVDYFEELSFSLRAQKFRIPENFPWATFKPIDVEKAKSIMKLLNVRKNIPDQSKNDTKYDVCIENVSKNAKKSRKVTPKNVLLIERIQRKLSLNENIQRLNLYWTLCGFGLLDEEISELSYALQKVQFHQNIQHARFWGKIYGLRKSYYIVEAQLIQSEIDIRCDKMREEIIEKITVFQEKKFQNMHNEEDQEFTPGLQWQNYSKEDLKKMRNKFEPIPILKNQVNFDIPPEPMGTGLHRRTYFVVNSLTDEWVELPVVDPEQVKISRKIKKILTGELNADIISFPDFPGSEKNYLRAMIARITSGTYVAPNNYYRRLTKKELIEIFGESVKEAQDELEESDIEDEEDEEEEEDLDNDALIIENNEYKPHPENLRSLTSWVHVRPNILEQGRIVYFDEKKALQALENGGSNFILRTEEEIEETDIEEDYIIEENDNTIKDSNPTLFSPCNQDKNDQNIQNWSVRYSSTHNKINQLTILHSNLWPGAYSFTFDKYSDSIYFGWGFKYNARNMTITQLPPIQDDNDTIGLDEIFDPTVEMEEAWRRFHQKKVVEEISEEEIEEEEDSC